MPIFDFRCEACGAIDEDYVPRRDDVPPCHGCGSVDRTKIFRGKGPLMIPDSIPGGMVIENIDRQPMTFYSKSDYKAELAARGMTTEGFHHIGEQGSDKGARLFNPNTGRHEVRSTRWI